MAPVDDLVMLEIAVAVAAVGIVGLMVALYAWALRRRVQMDEEGEGERTGEYPPDGRYQL